MLLRASQIIHHVDQVCEHVEKGQKEKQKQSPNEQDVYGQKAVEECLHLALGAAGVDDPRMAESGSNLFAGLQKPLMKLTINRER